MSKSVFHMSMMLLLAAWLVGNAMADQFQQIGWNDLIKHVEFDDPFTALTMDQLRDLSLVARIRELQTREREVGKGTLGEAETAAKRLTSANIDIDGLLARREEIRELRRQRATGVVEGLDGRQISMPGYALPLEYSGKTITEFLLVPWVGACIHTPPPPPNQIVYVKSESGFEIKGQFSPVVIKGEMSVKAAQKDLYLVDGSASIDVGYILQASAVEPYKVK